MNGFDAAILGYVNGFARHSEAFDLFVREISSSSLWKGGLLVAALWWSWFRADPRDAQVRAKIVAALVAFLGGLLVGRILALTLPFRLRPIFDPSVPFVLPYGVPLPALQYWSAFPSDHASAFFALATALCFISRGLGVAAFAYVAVMIALPRIYLGLHYPTDVLGGMVVGILVALLVCNARLRVLWDVPLGWMQRQPAPFYAIGFLLSLEMASMFDDFRQVAHTLLGMTTWSFAALSH